MKHYDKLIQLTWREHEILVYNRTNMELIKTEHLDGEGWGLTHNGTFVIIIV